MTDHCRDVLSAVAPSDARALLAVYRTAEQAAQALSSALVALDLSVTPSIGRDGGPYVLVVGGSQGTPEVLVSIPVGAVELLIRQLSHSVKVHPSIEEAA